jgi:hypothetical protein
MKMVLDLLRDGRCFRGRVPANDKPLIAEHALVRTAALGNEEGDDHGASHNCGVRNSECGMENKFDRKLPDPQSEISGPVPLFFFR